jgi:hypothetical protein
VISLRIYYENSDKNYLFLNGDHFLALCSFAFFPVAASLPKVVLGNMYRYNNWLILRQLSECARKIRILLRVSLLKMQTSSTASAPKLKAVRKIITAITNSDNEI